MLTPEHFKQLPQMVRRRVLMDCGLTWQLVEALSYPVKSMNDPVPPRRIACIQVNGRKSRRFYRKSDLKQFLGPEFNHG